MIELKNLRKDYDTTCALNISELSITKGSTFGLVGNNGAGKTTLFRLLLDLTAPTEGNIYIKDSDIITSTEWKSYTGAFLDESFLIDFLTPEEYLLFVGKSYGLSKAESEKRLKLFEDFFNGEILGKKKYIREYSKGNQKKVGIAAAILSFPELIILDEPFANLDPTTQIRLKYLLEKVVREYHCTLIVSSHDLNHITEVCNRIVVLQKGEVVKDITTQEETLKELEEHFSVTC